MVDMIECYLEAPLPINGSYECIFEIQDKKSDNKIHWIAPLLLIINPTKIASLT